MAKNRIVYSIVLIIASSFVGLYETKITYTALYSVILLPIFCILCMQLSGKKLSISERTDIQTVKKGETSQYFLTVKNNSFFPCPLIKAVFQSGYIGDKNKKYSTVTSEPKECFFSLSSHESKEIVFDMSGHLRGTFSVGVSEIYLYDPLGLICFRKKNRGNMTLTVIPNTIEIPYIPLSSQSRKPESGTSRSASFDEDYTSVEQLKKYTPADGYKKIHWKLSAKKNELISKEYQTVSMKSAVIIIYNTDFFEKRTPFEKMICEDKLTEAAVSITAYCEKHMISLSLHYLCSGSAVSLQSEEDLYTAVSNISFNESLDSDEFLFDIKNFYISGYRENIFIFTHNMNESFCNTVKALCLSGNHVILFCFLYENTNKEYENKIKELKTLGAVCFILSEKINAADAVSG